MKNNPDYHKFSIEISHACKNNDSKRLHYLLKCADFPSLEQKEKEDMAFISAYDSSNTNCLHYLIFEYRISVSKLVHEFFCIDESLKKSFKTRDLLLELKEEIILNTEKKSNKEFKL